MSNVSRVQLVLLNDIGKGQEGNLKETIVKQMIKRIPTLSVSKLRWAVGLAPEQQLSPEVKESKTR